MNLLHWLAHRVGWNLGDVQAFRRDGHYFVWFICERCGESTPAEHICHVLPGGCVAAGGGE